MNDEIKEILDKCTPFLFGDEVDKLLDYITNLQQENEKLKDELEWWKQQCDDLEMQGGVDYE